MGGTIGIGEDMSFWGWAERGGGGKVHVFIASRECKLRKAGKELIIKFGGSIVVKLLRRKPWYDYNHNHKSEGTQVKIKNH